MAKRSGHGDHRTRGNPYYEDDIPPALASAAFTAKTFELRPALVAQDGTSIQPHDGAPFDATQFRLDPTAWDHEHCDICNFCIDPGFSYWEGADGDVLCDDCYEHYVLKSN